MYQILLKHKKELSDQINKLKTSFFSVSTHTYTAFDILKQDIIYFIAYTTNYTN